MFARLFKQEDEAPQSNLRGFSSVFKKDFDEGEVPRDKYGKWTKLKYQPGTGFVGANKPLNAKDQERVAGIAIPPAWINVLLNPDPEGDTQVKGTDAKGRAQIKQHPDAIERNANAKWERVKAFHKTAYKPITAAAEARMVDKKLTQQQRDLAAVVNLVAKTGFRIGSDGDTGAAEQAYGASTLQKKHIKVKGDQISFTFVGKKAVTITKTITDAGLAKYITEKMSTLKPTDTVFNATDKQALAFIKETSGNANFKTKDFRTWHGTGLALYLRKQMQPPKNQKEYIAKAKEIATKVAEHLGNTPTVALSSYIAPYVFKGWDFAPPKKVKKDEGVSWQDISDTLDQYMDEFESGPVQDWTLYDDEDPDDEDVPMIVADPSVPDEIQGRAINGLGYIFGIKKEDVQSIAPTLAHIFKDTAASIKAWDTMGRKGPQFDAGKTSSQEDSIQHNLLLGAHYYYKRTKLGQDHPDTQDAYKEWQKSKVQLTAEHGFSKNAIGDLSLKAKQNVEKALLSEKKASTSLAAVVAMEKMKALGKITTEQHLTGNVDPEMLAKAKDAGATDSEVNTALKNGEALGGIKKTTEVSAKDKLVSAQLAYLKAKEKYDANELGFSELHKLQTEAEDAIFEAKKSMTGPQIAGAKASATIAMKAIKEGKTPASLKDKLKAAVKTVWHEAVNLLKDTAAYLAFKKDGDKHWDTLSYMEKSAVKAYTGSSYSQINKGIQHGDTAGYVDALDKVLDRPFPGPVKLRRNMPQKWFWKSFGLPHDDRKAMHAITPEQMQSIVGKTYREPSISSTTYNQNGALIYSQTAGESGAMRLKITAGPTARGFFVDKHSSSSSEQEAILARGATYLIKSVTKIASSPYEQYQYEVEAELIGHTK